MRGPKSNEGATVVGERPGTKATAKYVRSSAYKARVVLDLIRGLDVQRADQVLQFTQRGIAHDIRKVLASAVANASNPDNTGSYIADPDELFVLACFADEGPTLRRFRPRARGRATRIRKRTCHITIVVARMSDERLELMEARAEGAGASAAASRRARVERSRQRAEAAREAVDAADDDEIIDDETTDDETIDETTDDTAVDEVADADEPDEGSAGDESAIDSSGGSEADAGPDDRDGFEAAEFDGAVLPDEDGNGPDTHQIKGNRDSMLYHVPGSRYYQVTKAEVWFDTEESAEAAGFAQPGASSATDDSENN